MQLICHTQEKKNRKIDLKMNNVKNNRQVFDAQFVVNALPNKYAHSKKNDWMENQGTHFKTTVAFMPSYVPSTNNTKLAIANFLIN